MKKLTKITIIGALVIPFLFIASCKKNLIKEINEQNSTQDIESLVIDENFDWNMSQDVDVNIGIYENMDTKQGLENIVVELVDITTDNVLLRGNTNENGKLVSKFTMPTSSSYILVSTSFKDTVLGIYNGRIQCEFSTDSVIINGSLQSKKFGYRRGINNLFSNGDFESSIKDSNSSGYDKKMDLDKWYVREGDGKKVVHAFITKDGTNNVLKLKKTDEKGYPYAVQLIDGIEEGKKYTVSCKGKVLKEPSSTYFGLYIQLSDKVNGRTKGSYSCYNWTSKWTTNSFTITAPKKAKYMRVFLYINGYAKTGSEIIFDDFEVSLEGDKDNDGINDGLDDYPEDATRAFDNYYPAETKWASIVFEDMWPSKGDYEFNDLVLDYRMNPISNAKNQIVELKCKYKVRAIGAGYHNGYGVMLPIKASEVSNVTGQVFGHSYITLSANKTEAKQTNAVIIFFDDAFLITPHPGNGAKYVNTDDSETYVEPKEKEIVITFKTPQDPKILGKPPYNPFLIPDLTRGKEIHLPNNPPTDLADSKYFETEDDNSSSANKRYYLTKGTLPWALNVPYEFEYPIEKARITDAHLKFGSWAISSGKSYTDWYTNKSGYRNLKKLYRKR